NDLIMALGTSDEILQLAGPDTKRLDAQGRTVLPGIVDAHWHLTGFLVEDFPEVSEARVQVPPNEDRQVIKRESLELLRKKVQEVEPGEWILLDPQGDEARKLILYEEITRADLDRAAPDNPVLLTAQGGIPSQLLLNSKAREIMEEDFTGFKRLSDRQVKGVGTDLGAVVVKDLILKGTDKRYAESLRKLIIRSGPPTGKTTAGSRVVRTSLNAYSILERQGRLPIRFGWFYGESPFFDPPGFYRRWPDISGIGSKYLWNIGVGDELTDSPATGLCTTLTPINPELRERWRRSNLDPCFLTIPAIRETIKDQIQYGRGVEFHAGGDRSIDLLLEIIEEIRSETGMTVEDIREKRLTMEHSLLVRPDQLPKLKEYDITMTLAAGHMRRHDNQAWVSNIPKNFGEEYLKWHQPAKSMVDAGIRTIIAETGTDPWGAMEMFVVREACFTARLPEEGEVGVEKCRTITPEERVDRVTALKMHTIWPAYYMLKENEIGSLEVGKWADVIVIDRNFFTISETEISDIEVLLTVLGGEVVFASPDFGPVDRALFKSPDLIGDAALTN
ncbi:amidohydrolase family protein, partial [Acidobacteria bacterium AH-259-D05]|nr:amidohydrolase family protein [Acidobacteria bacterium AH-259-D05]